MASATYTLTADASELTAALDELTSLVESLDGRLELVDGLLGAVDNPSSLVRFESNTAVGAVNVTLQPSDLLLELLAAARAAER